MTDAEKAHWYRWAYMTVSDNPGMSVVVADKLRSLGLPIYKHEIPAEATRPEPEPEGLAPGFADALRSIYPELRLPDG